MIFAHIKLIQEGEASLFYNFNKQLNGYFIAGLLIAPNMDAKIAFSKIWKYFVSEIVQADDIYCTSILTNTDSLLNNCLEYYSMLEDVKVYKVTNYIKDKYSDYSKHIQRMKEEHGR